MNDIELRIDRLVIDGVHLSGAESRALHAAVEAELSRLLTRGGIGPALMSGGTMPAVIAPSIVLPAGSAPAALGERIAGAVYRGVGK